MLHGWLFALAFVAALGAGLIGGVFFAFSAFVIGALARLPPAQGIAAMQSINVVAVTPLFMTALFGTAGLCLVLVGVALLDWQAPGARWLVAGGLLYLGGVVVVTMGFNVPLNNALAAADPASEAGRKLWRRYLSVWTAWNHLRAAASLAAAAAIVLALR